MQVNLHGACWGCGGAGAVCGLSGWPGSVALGIGALGVVHVDACDERGEETHWQTFSEGKGTERQLMDDGPDS
jgi:hypothetical protein